MQLLKSCLLSFAFILCLSTGVFAADEDATVNIHVLDNVTNTAVKIDSEGRMLVSQRETAPPTSSEIVRVEQSNISSQTDNIYTITNGKTLTITLFQGGSESNSTGGSKIELLEDPNGDKSVLNIISAVYENGSSDEVNINEDFVGDGTRRIILRRDVFAGASREVFGRWTGFEE